MQFVYRHCTINCPDDMTEDEAKKYVDEEFNIERKFRVDPVVIDIGIEDDMVIIKPHYNTINRLRRITGYLSSTKNFNDAKKQEEQDRQKHINL